jgi:hypothetical protein
MTSTHVAASTPRRNQTTAARLSGALRRRWPTGVGIAATTAAMLLLALLPEDLAFTVTAWGVLVAAVIYLTWGTHRGHLDADRNGRSRLLFAQTTAVLAFGAIALAAVAVDRDLGVFVLAGGWLCHAGWDVAHHRMNAVVPRWYAEACLVCDVLVAISLLATTVL